MPLAAAIASLALLYLLGARVFASARFGVATACIFASTPLLWELSRAGSVSLYPLPFVAGWLLAAAHLQSESIVPWSAIAGIVLGVGAYTSYPAMLMMPLYLLLTIGVFAHARTVPSRRLGLMIAAFVVAVSPSAVSLLRHPEDFRNIVNTYHLYDANRFNLRQGVREMASWIGLTARSEVYYDYFNPAFLFLTGGVLLLPLAALLPAGLCQILLSETTPIARLSMAGFIAAPFAASLTAERPTPGRILFITPFAALVSVYGIKCLMAWRSWASSSGGWWQPVRPRRP